MNIKNHTLAQKEKSLAKLS